jgi:hypothetical protein
MDVRLLTAPLSAASPTASARPLTAKLARNGFDVSKLGGDAPRRSWPACPATTAGPPRGRARASAGRATDNGVDVCHGPERPAGDVFDKVLGVVETPITMATGIAGGLAGAVAGVGKAGRRQITAPARASTEAEIQGRRRWPRR